MASFFSRASFGSDDEAAAYHRAAWKLIPFLLILYIISFLDRVNVGFAKLQMSADIGLSDAVKFRATCCCSGSAPGSGLREFSWCGESFQSASCS
jgi:hypothetical protein